MKALEGIRVLDLSRVVSGPYCTMMLGDMGAEIIKVEQPDTGDETRSWGPPFVEGRSDSAYYMALNRNKKSISVNLKTEAGKKIISQLIEQSDVLVENFRVGTLERLGFGYEAVKEINPQLVYCSISGFGSSGPYAGKGGYDVIIQGMGGLMSITGFDEPVKVGIPIVDITTALFSVQGILAALFARARTGQGQLVETSLFESQLACLTNVGSNYLVSGKVPERLGNLHPNIAPYQPYKAKDGDFIVAVTNEKLWQNFCKAVEKPELSEDPRFAVNAKRLENRPELNGIIEPVLLGNTVSHWVKVFEKYEIPVGPINNIEQVFNDPQVKAREMLVEIEHPVSGKVKMTGLPVKFSDTKSEIRLAPPLLGEHNKEIICGLLRYSEDEYHDFQTGKII